MTNRNKKASTIVGSVGVGRPVHGVERPSPEMIVLVLAALPMGRRGQRGKKHVRCPTNGGSDARRKPAALPMGGSEAKSTSTALPMGGSDGR